MSNNLHAELTAEVAALINEFREISINAKRNTKRILNKATKPLILALFAAAPVSKRVHHRYSTPKVVRGVRAPKGKGVKVASYKPGNLAGSFRSLSFAKAPYSVVVGPKLAKGKMVTGSFSASNPDGYYAHMVEKGTKNAPARPFVAPTWLRMRGPVRQFIITDLQKAIKRVKK